MRTRKEIIEELSKAFTRRTEADKEIDALNAELKLLDEIPALPTYQYGDAYYRACNQFNVILDEITNPSNVHWNMFPTREYAEAFTKRAILLSKMLHCKWYLDRDYKPDWKSPACKFFLIYSAGSGKFEIERRAFTGPCTVCFSTQEKAERAAAWMNEHALDEMEERK